MKVRTYQDGFADGKREALETDEAFLHLAGYRDGYEDGKREAWPETLPKEYVEEAVNAYAEVFYRLQVDHGSAMAAVAGMNAAYATLRKKVMEGK